MSLVDAPRRVPIALEPVRVSPPEQQPPATLRPADLRLSDWPRTTRVLPWMIAAFIAMLWLVPFNTIMLKSSGPIDLQLDRLMLPMIAVIWLTQVLLGGATAPQLRVTGAHIAFGIFLLLSALSLVVNARMLNITRDLGGSIKQLSLIVAYLSFFLMVTSIVRPTEVKAFLKFTFILAVICSLGTIWEYNSSSNVFYAWTSKVFVPQLFSVQDLSTTVQVDEIGRRLVRGPAQHGLELTAMLAMALPMAIVGLFDSTRTRQRLGYGLAATLFLAAAIATFRKTAIIAPITAIVVLAAFRPRRVLRIAPLGLVVIVLVHALSPGALGSVIQQLGPQQFNSVSTVNDRTNDYDAVRPDVFKRPILGRGFGAYSEARYRILDNQLLGYLIMIGVIGLASYVGIMITVIALARSQIHSGDVRRASPWLIAASASAVFLVVSQLFDVMAFPHAPYVFLSLAGLAAATRPPKVTDEL